MKGTICLIVTLSKTIQRFCQSIQDNYAYIYKRYTNDFGSWFKSVTLSAEMRLAACNWSVSPKGCSADKLEDLADGGGGRSYKGKTRV